MKSEKYTMVIPEQRYNLESFDVGSELDFLQMCKKRGCELTDEQTSMVEGSDVWQKQD